MAHLRLLIIAFIFFLLPSPLYAQSGKIGDIFSRTWYIIAMKCPEELKRNVPLDEFSSYYFTMRWEPNNLNSVQEGKYEKIYRDIIEGQRESGNYVINTNKLNEGRMVLDAGYGNKKEYLVRLSDQNHMTMTLVTNDPAERCKVFYAVAR